MQNNSELLKDMEKKMSLNDDNNPEIKPIEKPVEPEQSMMPENIVSNGSKQDNKPTAEKIEAPEISEIGEGKVEVVEKKIME